jgi:hypothetical protein
VNLLAPATLFGLAAAVPAVLAEYLYKKWGTGPFLSGPWWHGLWMWVPLQLSIGYFIYRLVQIPNTTLMDAFVVWAFSTTALRVLVSLVILGETIKGGTWFALGLLIMARLAQSFWGR